jgi:hypothetical protein
VKIVCSDTSAASAAAGESARRSSTLGTSAAARFGTDTVSVDKRVILSFKRWVSELSVEETTPEVESVDDCGNGQDREKSAGRVKDADGDSVMPTRRRSLERTSR